jgi:hypothetical protein
MMKKCSLAILVMFLISIVIANSSCGGSVNNQLSSTQPPPKIEVAGVNTSEFLQLRKVMGDVVVQAKTSANQDQKSLLTQVETILGAVQSDSQVENVVLQKTENEQIISNLLEKAVGALAQYLGIPSPIAEAAAKGIGEVSSLVGQWWGMGKMGWARITLADKGVITLVYQKDLKEVWVNADVSNPAGSLSMYTPVEISSVKSDNAGSSPAAVMLKAVVGNSKVAYRFGTSSSSVTKTPTPSQSATQQPSAQYTNVTYYQFLSGFSKLTDLQQQDYLNKYKGKGVKWIGEVSEVTSEGSGFIVTFKYDYGWAQVIMDITQKAVLSTTNKGDLVMYEGIVDNLEKLLPTALGLFSVKLKSGRIISQQVLEPVWALSFIQYFDKGQVLITEDYLYILNTNSKSSSIVTAVDVQMGKKRWEKEYPEYYFRLAHHIIGHNEQCIFLNWFDGRDYLQAIDKTTGTIVWTQQFQQNFNETSEMAEKRVVESKGMGFVTGNEVGRETKMGNSSYKIGLFSLTANRLSDGQLLWEKKWQDITLLGSTKNLLLVFSYSRQAKANTLEAYKVSEVQ